MNPPWELMDDVVGKLESDEPEAVLIAPAFTHTRWWGKLIVSGAACLKLNKHFGLFRRFGTDAMEAPRWDVWAFHFKRVERADVPANIVLGVPQGDPTRIHSGTGRRDSLTAEVVTSDSLKGGGVCAGQRAQLPVGRGRPLPGPMEKFVFARPLDWSRTGHELRQQQPSVRIRLCHVCPRERSWTKREIELIRRARPW